jgi:FtsH-binding integral membrane protein
MLTEISSTQIQTTQSTYISKVFGWMFYAMLLSGVAAVLVFNNTAMQDFIFGSPIRFYGLLIAEFVIVLTFSGLANRVSSATALLLFSVYSVLTGLTLSVILFAYAPKTIGGAFLMASSVYGIMAIIGFVTKKSLSGIRVFLLMGLISVIVVSIANIFLKSTGLNLILNYVTLFVFSGLTAYDMQRIKNAGYQTTNRALQDALSMYLNFINIFISILNIVNGGRRR